MVRTKVGYEHIKVLQDFENLAIIASKIFGGEKKKNNKRHEVLPEAVRPQNTEEMMAAFNSVFSPQKKI